MRRLPLLLAIALALPSLAQTSPPPPRRNPQMMRPIIRAENIETYVKQASEQLATAKKAFDRDIEVLTHVRAADNALVDNMQPANAVQKAYEEIVAAKTLNPPFDVYQGVIASERILEDARRSPMTADFGHLRSVLREQALGPASRTVVRNALRLDEEAAEWIKVQQMISDHLRAISDISSQSLRASEQ